MPVPLHKVGCLALALSFRLQCIVSISECSGSMHQTLGPREVSHGTSYQIVTGVPRRPSASRTAANLAVLRECV